MVCGMWYMVSVCVHRATEDTHDNQNNWFPGRGVQQAHPFSQCKTYITVLVKLIGRIGHNFPVAVFLLRCNERPF